MADVAGTGRNRRKVGASAKKRMAAPLLAAKLPHATIAELLDVSTRTIARWASEDEVRADVAAVADNARAEGEQRITRLVHRAFDALEESLRSDDERIRLDAAKTTLDRFGYPVTSKSEASHAHSGNAGVRLIMATPEVLEELAKEEA